MNSQSIHLVSASGSWCNALKANPSSVISLQDGFNKIFNDAQKAISTDECVEKIPDEHERLAREQEIELCRCHDTIPELVNYKIVYGECWADSLDQGNPALRAPVARVDLLLMTCDQGTESTLCVEGKLGVYPIPRQKKIRRPRYEEVVSKFEETKRRMQRLQSAPPLLRTVCVLVNNRSKEYTKHRFDRKNKENTGVTLCVLCPSEFLCNCGFNAAFCSAENHCPIANLRDTPADVSGRQRTAP